MTAEEYLSQYRQVQAEIIQRDILIRRMRQEIFGGPTGRVTAAIDGVMGGATAGATWDVHDLEAMQGELRKQEQAVTEFRRFMTVVIRQVNQIEWPDFRTLLYGRYINLQDWQEIADCLKYSADYVRKELKNAALDEFSSRFFDKFYKVPTNTPESPPLDVV